MAEDSARMILKVLAKEWEMTGPPGILDISDLSGLCPLSPGDFMASLKELYAQGFVDMNTIKTSAFLTPKGYDQALGRRAR